MTTELHVHDWTPWGLSPLSDAAGVMRRQRSCRGCELYQDEPTPDVPVGLVPDSAIEAAAKALYAELEPYVSHSRMTYSGSIGTRTTGIAEAVLAAAVPHIERAIRDRDTAELRSDEMLKLVRRACNDPGGFVKRGEQWDGEPNTLGHWQALAVVAALAARVARGGEGDIGELQRELDDLERSDPDVAAAAKSYDAMRDKIIADRRVARGGEATE